MKNASKMSHLGLLMVGFLVLFTGCQGMLGPVTPQDRIVLFNGKDFAGWKLYLPDTEVDVNDVWSVQNGVVHCMGKPNGYMRTKKTYQDYHLHLEWRWAAEPTNSGVLLHAQGEEKVWPLCIEAQLKTNSAGDFVLIGGPGLTVDGKDWQDTEKQYVIVPKNKPSNEKTPGGWNMYDIYCEGDSIRCYVNGVLQNAGTKATITAGWICLQSEGSPIEFRNIYLDPLK